MSDTPRTDAQAPWIESPQLDFARQLEHELAEAREQRDRLAEALQELNDAPWLNMPGRACDIVQEALAAVKGESHE
jgi:hypothetical protein